jgi:hypothetical protein
MVDYEEEDKGKEWDDITQEYLEQVAQKTELTFEEEYEEGLNTYSVKDIVITETSREKKESAVFRIEFKIEVDPEYDEETKECCTNIISPVEYDSTNITLFEDKVYEAIMETIGEELEDDVK